MSHSAKVFLLLYLFMFAVFISGQPLNGDSYYYWDWSYHLALSYYDGPPLIAYAIRVLTTIFGNHVYSLDLLLFISIIVTAVVVFRLGRQLFNHSAATMAMMIWLLTLNVVNTFFVYVLYDTLLIMFWALTFYAFVKLVSTQQRRYYYYCAVFAGLLLLSKYTGVLLLISMLLLCIIEKRYRFVWRSPHSYLAMLITLLISSPILVWNWQHGWASFHFQLAHGFTTYHLSAWVNITKYFHDAVTGANVAFIALLYVLAVHYREIMNDERLRLLLLPTLVTWVFFLFSGFFSLTLSNWNTPFMFTNALLLGPLCHRGMPSRWLRTAFLIVLAVPTVTILIMLRVDPLAEFKSLPKSFTIPAVFMPPAVARNLLQQLPPQLYRQQPLFISGSYGLGAYLAAFLPGKRYQVFGLTPAAHQYFYWWQQAKTKFNYDRGLYFNLTAIEKVPAPLNDCQLLMRLHQQLPRHRSRMDEWQIFVYACRIET
ncbi:MAG: glycosyltransferase family 39 protein [Gammaproteobacteria bacterium]|nr:glycosyltransferase family 39 protein [Gammaproteobacteria bacterium]